MIENEFHSLIKNDKDIQKKLCSCLHIEGKEIDFVSEDQFPNGILVDFTILVDGRVRALVEIKGDNIGINDYVRGTGQVFQYQNFIDLRESIKNYLFQDAFAVYLFPSGIISKGAFNIGIMSYPKNSKIVEYNEKSKLFRLITKKDLAVLAGKKGKTVTTISQYYIRDTRLFELYIALRYICLLKINSLPMLTRENLDLELQKLNVPDNGNWRNAFISLSSLGFIDNDNLPTEKGLYLGIHNFCDFAYTIYIDYIKPYVDLIQYAIDESNANKNPTSLIELRNLIEKSHGNQKILFLTDSGTRYLSSWLNIMRDDYNCIKFISGKTNRTYMIEYRLSQFNEGTIKEKIKYNTFANNYIANSIQLFKETYLLKEIGDKK